MTGGVLILLLLPDWRPASFVPTARAAANPYTLPFSGPHRPRYVSTRRIRLWQQLAAIGHGSGVQTRLGRLQCSRPTRVVDPPAQRVTAIDRSHNLAPRAHVRNKSNGMIGRVQHTEPKLFPLPAHAPSSDVTKHDNVGNDAKGSSSRL